MSFLLLHENGAVAAACLLQRLPAYPAGKAPSATSQGSTEAETGELQQLRFCPFTALSPELLFELPDA